MYMQVWVLVGTMGFQQVSKFGPRPTPTGMGTLPVYLAGT